jgi:hypothetical protein
MASISTRDLSHLPPVDHLWRLLQSLATLDTILTGDSGGGYYSFQSRWGRNQQLGVMDNGSGDQFHAYFNCHGCFLKGFAHESSMTPYRVSPPSLWPGLLDGVPAEFDAALNEPAFDLQATTFAIWRLYSDSEWQCGKIRFPDDPYGYGSGDLLVHLDGAPTTYVAWAIDYYERDIDPAVVEHVYQQLPLTNDVVRRLNPDASVGKLHNGFVQIGYPGF